ncbi:hypothetical protein Thiowin_04476 [Thiorhodovibrio winogradskyi]|uniref:Putative restriction endonuclease domain-containing protein n=1 Tax=Thiorhodovibrio winogradskyi TaxID=77007 RepID=A0ABZ0SFR6_9GAMM|nr:Uma2 family endonuclease [Thiorhodovibrio winogradskyi]
MSAPAFALADPPKVDPAPNLPVDPPEGARVSEMDYWAHYYEHENGYEWNNGLLEVKPVSDVLTYQIYQWLLGLLRCYLETHQNARLTALDMGFRLELLGKVTIRKPDLGLVRDDNAVPLEDLDRSYHGTFDLCVEALSDSTAAEIRRDTEQKRREYEAVGVPEYYILHHQPRWQLFYRRNASGRYQPMPREDGIIRSAILPGFQFRLEDFTRRPTLDAMIEDPIYAAFVLPKWQRERAAWTRDREALAAEREALAAERDAREQAERIAQQERAEKEALLAELARMRNGA